MRIAKDPFTKKLIVSLDEFEGKQIVDKKYFNITYQSLKVFFEDIQELITSDLKKIEQYEERKRNEDLFNK